MPVHFAIDDVVAHVTLDTPGKLNAVDVSMWRDLRAIFERMAGDLAVHCVVLRGAGGHFAAGADIAEFPHERFDLASGRRYHLQLIAPALQAIADAPQVVIAAIEGNCVGGGLEIASVCDVRIAATDSRIGAPVGRLGFPLALPELAPLLRLAGPALLSDLLLTGRLLSGDEAWAHGLVQRVVPPAVLDTAIADVVAAVRSGSPLAARLNKRNLRMLAIQGGQYTDAQLDASFAFFDSRDYTEGMTAFLQRRPPRFTGN